MRFKPCLPVNTRTICKHSSKSSSIDGVMAPSSSGKCALTVTSGVGASVLSHSESCCGVAILDQPTSHASSYKGEGVV